MPARFIEPEITPPPVRANDLWGAKAFVTIRALSVAETASISRASMRGVNTIDGQTNRRALMLPTLAVRSGGAQREREAMIIEYIRYKVGADDAGALVDAYRVAATTLRGSEHCLGFELSRCTEAPESFVLRIIWDSLAGHLQGFRSSPEFQSFFAAIKPFVTQIEEMRHYELTPVEWKREP
jgi:quinol monooxygenase YgiN